MNSLFTSASRRRLRFAVPGLALFLAAACASTPPPATNLQAAQQAIATAEGVDAATHAAVELGEARAKLSLAQNAVVQEDMIGSPIRRAPKPNWPPPGPAPPRLKPSTRT